MNSKLPPSELARAYEAAVQRLDCQLTMADAQLRMLQILFDELRKTVNTLQRPLPEPDTRE